MEKEEQLLNEILETFGNKLNINDPSQVSNALDNLLWTKWQKEQEEELNSASLFKIEKRKKSRSPEKKILKKKGHL